MTCKRFKVYGDGKYLGENLVWVQAGQNAVNAAKQRAADLFNVWTDGNVWTGECDGRGFRKLDLLIEWV